MKPLLITAVTLVLLLDPIHVASNVAGASAPRVSEPLLLTDIGRVVLTKSVVSGGRLGGTIELATAATFDLQIILSNSGPAAQISPNAVTITRTDLKWHVMTFISNTVNRAQN